MQLILTNADDLKAISRALRHHADGRRLRSELVAELKAAAAPMVPRIQAAWRAAPAHQGRRYGRQTKRVDLRELLARSTWVQARLTGKEAGVRIRSDGRRMPDHMKALPGYAEGIRRRGWRHPVFGNREVWQDQRPFPRFYVAARPDEVLTRRRVNDAIDAIFNEIARAR